MTRARNLANLANVDTFTVDSSDRVGLGTTNPQQLLHLAHTNPRIRIDDTDSGGYYTELRQGGSATYLHLDGGNVGSGNFRITADGGNEIFRFNDKGNVSIAGSTTSFDANPTVDGLQLYYETDTRLATIASYDGTSGSEISIGTNDGSSDVVEAIRIDSSGNVGIGSDNPSWALDVRRNTNTQARFVRDTDGDSFLRVNSHGGNIVGLQLGDDGDADKQQIRSDNTNNALIFNTANAERVRVSSAGSFGILTNDPESDLHVHGNALIQDTTGNNLTVRSTVNNGNDPNIRFQKARGGGTPAVVQDNDDCGDLSWAGYDGDSYEVGADILGEVEGTPADGDMPMRLLFKTRSAGAASAQIRLSIGADGTVSLVNDSNLQIPDKIIHDGDTDTAIRFPAADTISAETGGSERLRINSAGSVGIGTDNPSTKLHVEGSQNILLHLESTDAFSGITMSDTGGSVVMQTASGYLRFLTGGDAGTLGTNSEESLRITSNGKIGIGTDNPSTKLHVSNGISGFSGSYNARTAAVVEGDNSTGITLSILAKSSGYSGIFFGDEVSETGGQLQYVHSTDSFRFITGGGTENLRLDDGKVGIGTASPSSLLHLSSNAPYITFEDEDNNQDWQLQATAWFALRNQTTSSELLRVDSSGNVGINETSPQGLLDLKKDNATGEGATLAIRNTGSGAETSVALHLVPNNGGGNDVARAASIKSRQTTSGNYADLGFFTANSDTPVERMTISASGNVGIATDDPTEKLSIGRAGSYINNTGIAVFKPHSLGLKNGIFVYDDIGYNSSSSYRTAAFKAVGTAGHAFAVSDDAGTDAVGGTNNAHINFDGSAYFAGNFGINAESPNGRLNIFTNSNEHALRIDQNHTSALVQFLEVESTSYSGDGVKFHYFRSATSGNSFIACDSNHSVGGAADREFTLRGDGNAYADGTWNNNGADYAEFFESSTGAAIPVGTTVVLENNKVRAATSEDSASSIMGVVRPKEPGQASMTIGNSAWNKWTNKYLTDDFDRFILDEHLVYEWTETVEDGDDIFHSYESHQIPEGVTIPSDVVGQTHDSKGNRFVHYRLNPDFDSSLTYVPREERDEWIIVGLIGQVKILDGQPMNDRWIKMRDVSDTVEEWFIR